MPIVGRFIFFFSSFKFILVYSIENTSDRKQKLQCEKKMQFLFVACIYLFVCFLCVLFFIFGEQFFICSFFSYFICFSRWKGKQNKNERSTNKRQNVCIAISSDWNTHTQLHCHSPFLTLDFLFIFFFGFVDSVSAQIQGDCFLCHKITFFLGFFFFFFFCFSAIYAYIEFHLISRFI